MASGDFLDLSEHAARAAQFDPADTTGDLAQAKAKINEAYLSCLADGSPWDFLEREGQWTTAAGSDKYTYSSIATGMSLTGASIRQIHYMVMDPDNDGGYKMQSMSWAALEEFASSTQDDESTGEPEFWATWGSQGAPTLRVFPSPDAVYTIGVFCYLAPAEMSANGDTPLIPLAFRHRVLVPYAAALLLEQEGGPESINQSRVLMERYESGFERMRVAHATAKRPTFSAVQPGFYERTVGPW